MTPGSGFKETTLSNSCLLLGHVLPFPATAPRPAPAYGKRALLTTPVSKNLQECNSRWKDTDTLVAA